MTKPGFFSVSLTKITHLASCQLSSDFALPAVGFALPSVAASQSGTPREGGEGGREFKNGLTFMMRGDVSRIMKVNTAAKSRCWRHGGQKNAPNCGAFFDA
jgi:hypothetical protein